MLIYYIECALAPEHLFLKVRNRGMPSELCAKPLSTWGIPFDRAFLIAGPCSLESEMQIMRTAELLANETVHVLRAGIWKPRTRPGSFEGIGKKGLRWLKRAGESISRPVAVEVATARHVQQSLEAGVDILWIGARTTANPFSVQEIADSLAGVDIPVLVKNPVNPDIELWIGALERLCGAGVKKIGAIHRGFSTLRKTAYRNVPSWRIPLELKRRFPDLPLLCDPSHICGKKDLLFSVAQEAIDLLFDGVMIEVHHDPAAALSDSEQQITPAEYHRFLQRLTFKQRSADDPGYIKKIEGLRKNIDRVDNKLLELLAERMQIAERIGTFKAASNVATFQPERYEQIVNSRIAAGRGRGLSKSFILRVYQLIHEEAIRHQEHQETDSDESF
jgi:chorismate mutase